MKELSGRLQEPFSRDEISWRVGTVARSGKRATLLAYIDARAVMDRLDEVVGPARWRNSYRTGAEGGLICRLELLVSHDGESSPEWVGKEDGAPNTKVEAVKGGMSDAFKRAGVKWGIGRYLYRLKASYYDIQDGWANGKGIDVTAERKHIGWISTPSLPPWAMPSARKETGSEQQVRRAGHDLDWESGGRARFMAQLAETGLSYEEVKVWLASKSKPKPSTQSGEKRDALIAWLGADPARVERIKTDQKGAEK